jgi:tRNA1(Val) A37 N6-methylase TrmN6
MSETTQDRFFGGRLLLTQPRRGHRAGLDAALLAVAAPVLGQGLALDAGAGVGSAGLAFAARAPGMRVGLIENDPRLPPLALANVEANGLSDRVSVFAADLMSAKARRAAGLAPETADVVLTNPPFLDPARSRVSVEKAAAHAMPRDGALADWLKACFALLRPGGTLTLIHRADALAELVAACSGRGGDIRILPVHATADAPAIRLLIRAVKGSRKPLSLMPGLVLHESDGAYRPEAEALLRGAASIDWREPSTKKGRSR